eukprot:PLAT11858.1.p1 GENE.PLAT11858.1~~PLAT11858.1.p1  ORF type:complete len:470 (-),score=246.17 PLAT11858.1:83-1492(-)
MSGALDCVAFLCKLAKSGQGYSLYVLLLLLLTYLTNQLDRYLLGITSKELERDLHFGDGKGGGEQYQLLAGPVFTLIYTFAGIPIGFLADKVNRKRVLAFALAAWSGFTALTALAHNYTFLVFTRFGLGFAEAACTPLAAGLIADYFPPESRATALGVYNWGIYMGYSFSYAVGNLVTKAYGWRATYIACGLPGVLLALVVLTTVKEPERGVHDRQRTDEAAKVYSFTDILRFWGGSCALLVLCFASAIRNSGGYVWAFNTELFFAETRHLGKDEIAAYMSWIPLVGGSLGATFGGFISDRIVKKRGPAARILVLIASQVLAAPFAAGALLLPTPWNFLSLIPANVIGEMWVGVALAVIGELVPPQMRVTSTSIYFFIISNIGGAALLLVPVFTDFYSGSNAQRNALLWLYPGNYLLSAVFFFAALVTLRRDLQRAAMYDAEEGTGLLKDEEAAAVEDVARMKSKASEE